MSDVTAQQAQDYIEAQGYLGLRALADRAGTTPEQVRAFEQAECIPAASYEVAGEVTFTSSFGRYALPVEPRRYYHPSVVEWLQRAMALADGRDLGEVARAVRAAFDSDFDAALRGAPPPWSDGADYAWAYMTDGTWGLCLKDVSIAGLLAKEQARATIRRLVQPEPDHRLSEAERRELEQALSDYERVALPFSPHEVAESSRAREIQPAREKYVIATAASGETDL